MKKEAAAQAAGQGLTPEQVKAQQEAQAKAQKENTTVKTLNEKLLAAKTATDAGDFDSAIATLTEATQVDANRDLLWFKLGDAYRMSAPKQTDPAEKQKRFGEAADAYKKAIDLKTANPDPKDAEANQKLAAYYNNLAEADAKSNKVDDAVGELQQGRTARSDPRWTVQLQCWRSLDQCRQSGRRDRGLRQGNRSRSRPRPTPITGRASI